MTVRKRKDTGQWICDFYYNGERIKRALKFARTRKEAEQAEAVVMNNVFRQAYGLEAIPDKRFEDFVVETFLSYSEANKKSFRCDVLACRVLVKAFKGKYIRQITPPMIETFKQEFLNTPTKHGKKRSPATVNIHLRILSKILSLAVDAELITRNPCFRVKKFRLNNRRLRVLTDDEEIRLLKELEDNQQLANMVTVALNTGLRRGEIFNLEWPDIDLVGDLILVRKTKSDKERFVPMNETVRELLSSLSRTSDYVFPSPQTGGKLTDLKTGFLGALRRAGIKDFRFHDLRHTAATRMADGGADVFTIMEILGHSDIRTTVIYTHARNAAMRQAVGNLNKKSILGPYWARNGNGDHVDRRKSLKTLEPVIGLEPTT